MTGAISNTSPLVYLHRAGVLSWLTALFDSLWIPKAVVDELREGRRLGFDVPNPDRLPWATIRQPERIPAPWLALDLGPGELAAMALARASPTRTLLLDDLLARRTAQAAGLTVWGTLRVVLEAKGRGLTPAVSPIVDRLRDSGMWISKPVQRRILDLAGESLGGSR